MIQGYILELLAVNFARSHNAVLFFFLQGTLGHVLECGSPGGGGGTPLNYLYGYVPPKGVVILKLLI